MSRSGTPRTYSVWAVLGLLTVIGLVGLVGVLLVGSPRTPTVQLAGDQRLEEPTDEGPAGTASPTTSEPTPAPVTVPGGAPAPEGVSDVLRTEESTSFTFEVRPETISGSSTTAVPPTRVAFSADGSAVNVTVSCAASASEVLALVSVTEAAGSVTVLAVVLVPDGGPPCDPVALPREVSVPLAAPAAGRTLTAVPAGTAVSGFTPG